MRHRIALGALAVALLAAGCGESTGPTAGNLVVVLAGTTPARAVLFRLVGQQTSVTASGATNYRVFSTPLGGDTTRVAVIAAAGATLAPGPIVTIAVANTRIAGQYSAVVAEAAAPSYAPITVTTTPVPFVLTVTRP